MKRLLMVLPALVSTSSYAQKIDIEDIYANWYLDKYADEEHYYHPPKKEMDDFLSLGTDWTYTAVSEGKRSEGTWIFNANGKYIELKAGNGKKEKLYLHFLSDKSMVVTYDTDEYRQWEVHYVSLKDNGK